MFTKELFRFLLKIISSWQVIAVTVTLIVYFSLVSYVARLYHPRRAGFSFASRPRKEKKQVVQLPEAAEEEELDLEE